MAIMNEPAPLDLRLPKVIGSMTKGDTLKELLGKDAIACLSHNLAQAYPQLDRTSFIRDANAAIGPLGIMKRGPHIAHAMRDHLPMRYETAVEAIIASLTPPTKETEDRGLGVFFYHPHGSFISEFGLNPDNNDGNDPFEISMRALYEITKRFTSEFSIRPFIEKWPKKTMARLKQWVSDADPHVRRLCTEGTRSRLPWASHLKAHIVDPSPVLPILETLKDDPVLYVRRSVANHLGDIAKDHPDLVYDICRGWLNEASDDRKWLIRHALRHPAKKGFHEACLLRKMAK